MTHVQPQLRTVSRNVAVPVGALLILGCFFLPWLRFQSRSASGLDLVLAGQLRLVLVPVSALVVFLFRVLARNVSFFSRLSICILGILLATGFGYAAVGLHNFAAPALWFTFSGGLLIAVGALFDLVHRV